MPELPEVETIVRELQHSVAGAKLGRVVQSRKDVQHGDPEPLTSALPGHIVRNVRRRAKRIIFELSCKHQLVFHLGMSGRLTLAPVRSAIEKHTHLRIKMAQRQVELRFCDPRRFGGVWWLTGSNTYVGRRLGSLGLEPLEMSAAQFRKIINRNRQIKALLLDQRMIAGLGNIYCDEALHRSRLHPLQSAADLEPDQAARLLRAIKSTLRQAITHRGSTLTNYRDAAGEPGEFQHMHRVYGREDQPCQSCGTKIVRIQAAGRSSHYCPACQPAPPGV